MNEIKKERIGLFGGSFNPVHVGHINSMLTVQQKMGLDKIYVIPARQNPLKKVTEGPTPQQRLEMVRLAIEEFQGRLELDEQEIHREGASYSIDTIDYYSNKVSPENLYLIVGMDKFDELEKWKSYQEILRKTNLIVTSRPGFEFPSTRDEIPQGLKKYIADFDFGFIQLTTGRTIQFQALEDVNISASEIRRRLRGGKNLDRYLTINVEKYIREHGLYSPIGPKVGDFQKFTTFCANRLFARKGINVIGFDLRKHDAPSEYVLIASGTSTRHTSAMAQYVIQSAKEHYGILPYNVEGINDGRWVVVDFGGLIIHIFYDYVRMMYRLEELWSKKEDLRLIDPAAAKLAKTDDKK